MRPTENQLRVLISLARGPKHGYAIVKDIERHSRQKIRLSAGTLYPIINRLERDGLIVESRQRPARELDDERRRYYEITASGRRILVEANRDMQEMLDLIDQTGLLEQPS